MIRFTSLEVEPADFRNRPHECLELKEFLEEMAALPDDLRESLYAWKGAHPDGLSCRELGARQGVTGQTICNRARRAERWIRERYGEN